MNILHQINERVKPYETTVYLQAVDMITGEMKKREVLVEKPEKLWTTPETDLARWIERGPHLALVSNLGLLLALSPELERLSAWTIQTPDRRADRPVIWTI